MIGTFAALAWLIASMVCGMISMKDIKKVGSIGWKTLVYYIGTTIVALIIGLVLALIVLQMLESGLNLLGVSSYLTMALWGAVLILFIALQNRKA